jgi:hypothetical protein
VFDPPTCGNVQSKEVRLMLTMLAQYGNNGGGGGGISYGPVFWLIVAAVVVLLVGLGTWFLRSRKSRSAGHTVEASPVGRNERAA